MWVEVWGLRFGVWGLGCRVLGFGVWGLGFEFLISNFQFLVFGFGVWVLGSGVWGLCFRFHVFILFSFFISVFRGRGVWRVSRPSADGSYFAAMTTISSVPSPLDAFAHTKPQTPNPPGCVRTHRPPTLNRLRALGLVNRARQDRKPKPVTMNAQRARCRGRTFSRRQLLGGNDNHLQRA